MTDTLSRQWTMLRAIPLAPRKVSTAQLADQLRAAGFDVDLRTVQRDLHKLGEIFPLVVDDHKPAGWSWRRESPAFELPGMDLHAALAWRLAGAHVLHLLPQATRDHLQPYVQRADQVLAHATDNRLSRWSEKVRVIDQGLSLVPPPIDGQVLETVERALFTDRQLRIGYRRRGEADLRGYTVHPLGLVWRGATGYLVATAFSYRDPIQFALHRVDGAEVLAAARSVPDGFTIDAYIAAGAFDFLVGAAPLDLVVRVHPHVAARLHESPLGEDQRATIGADGWSELSATVADTTQLRVWLHGHADHVEIVAPASLRAEFAATSARIAARYAAAGGPGAQESAA